MSTSLHNKRYVKLRYLLKKIRKDAGLTQVQLAKLLHMEQSNLSKIECGERYLDILVFINYCVACGAVPSKVISELDGLDGLDD